MTAVVRIGILTVTSKTARWYTHSDVVAYNSLAQVENVCEESYSDPDISILEYLLMPQ